MTVTSQTTKVTTAGNGSSFTYSFSPMVIFASTDIVVTSTVIATGVETTLVEGTGAAKYSVGITTYPATGSITYPQDEVTAVASTANITVKRTLTLEQQTDLNNQGGYFADTQETQFDKLLMIDLQQQEDINRSFKLPVSYSGSLSLEVPSDVAASAGDVPALNTGKTALEWLTPNSSTYLTIPLPVASGGTGSITASAARTALGVVIGTDVLAPNGSALSLTGLPGKNLVINGGFQVNQRVYVSTTATADGTYMHDRWRSGTANSSYTFSTASPCSPQTVTIAANDSIEQVIAGENIGTAGTHTISWTGTATARAVVNTQTMSGNFAVSPITVTAVLDQVITMQFTGADAAGGSTIATNTGTLGKVQCEFGSVATSFEYRPYNAVLALCQNYYRAIGKELAGMAKSTNTIDAQAQLSPPMRTETPTVALLDSSSVLFYQAVVGSITATTLSLGLSRVGSGRVYVTMSGLAGMTVPNFIVGDQDGILSVEDEL